MLYIENRGSFSKIFSILCFNKKVVCILISFNKMGNCVYHKIFQEKRKQSMFNMLSSNNIESDVY